MNIDYLTLEKGFITKSAELGCDEYFIKGCLKTASDISEAWDQQFTLIEEQSGDKQFRAKLAAELLSLSKASEFDLGGITKNIGDYFQNGGLDKTLTGIGGAAGGGEGLGGMLGGGGGGALVGMLLGKLLFDNPMAGLMLGGLGGGALGGAYGSGMLGKMFGGHGGAGGASAASATPALPNPVATAQNELTTQAGKRDMSSPMGQATQQQQNIANNVAPAPKAVTPEMHPSEAPVLGQTGQVKPSGVSSLEQSISAKPTMQQPAVPAPIKPIKSPTPVVKGVQPNGSPSPTPATVGSAFK